MDICQNKIPGGNRNKCWLPVSPGSPWKFCRRCTWNQETQVLEQLVDSPLTAALETLKQPWFLPAFRHNQRRDLLVSILSKSYQTTRPLYDAITETIRGDIPLQRVLEHAYRDHTGVNPERCHLFRHLVRRGNIDTLSPPAVLPERCLECLVWGLYSRKIHYDRVLFLCLRPQNPIYGHLEGSKSLSILADLYNHPGGHANGHIIPQSDLVTIMGRENFKHFLTTYVLGHPKWYNRVCVNKQPSFWFLEQSFWDDKEPPVRSCYYAFLKRRMVPLKEELIQKTWHPSRFMAWCLDEEEKADFMEGYS
jgi:hypothetical protein